MDPFNISDLFCIKDNILIGSKTGDLDEKKQNCINIGNLILKSFISNPNFVGQVDGETGEENTFQQMREKTVKCALWMQKSGVNPHNVIMICTNNHLDAYIPFLAALYIDAVVSPLDMYYNLDMIDIFVEQLHPVMLFVNEKFYNIVDEKINQLQIFDDNTPTPIIIAFNSKKKKRITNENLLTLEKILNLNYDPFNIENFSCTKLTNMGLIAIRLFTPGTTAFPVQVGIRHFAFVAPSDQQAPNMRKNDIALLCESLCYINGIFMTIQAILLHVKVIRIKVRFNPKTIYRTIEKYKVTWVFLETNLCNRLIKLCQFKGHDFPSLRTVVFGGSTTNSEKIHNNLRILLPNTNILQIYSLTETGIIAYQRQPGKSGSCGYVSANVQLKIVTTNTLNERYLLGPELLGEIYCLSPYMAAVLKYNSEEYEGWFKTGDLGYYDKDGDIFIVDRINQIFNVEKRYLMVLPSKIENLLLSHYAVLEAIVIPLPIDDNDQYSVAFIRKIPGIEVTEKEIKKFLIENNFCPIELRSVIFTRIKLWPYLSNGKINRRILLNMVHSTTFWNIPLTNLSDTIICTF